MASLKAAAKAARTALESKEYETAEAQSRKVLSFDPQHYFGNVFLGISLFNLKQYEESEKAYRDAIAFEAVERANKDKKEHPSAWQGLVNLYEAQKRVNELLEAAVKLATIYRDIDIWEQCQTAVDKMVAFVKENGSPEQASCLMP
ncbi:Superkiller protein 3 [Rhizina undulata]